MKYNTSLFNALNMFYYILLKMKANKSYKVENISEKCGRNVFYENMI